MCSTTSSWGLIVAVEKNRERREQESPQEQQRLVAGQVRWECERIVRLPLQPALVLCLAMAALARGADDPSYGLILGGGRVADGTGNARFLGDVAIRGDTIARITPAGRLGDAPTKKKIDVAGLVVAPGLIDIQGHLREGLLSGDGRLIGKVT